MANNVAYTRPSVGDAVQYPPPFVSRRSSKLVTFFRELQFFLVAETLPGRLKGNTLEYRRFHAHAYFAMHCTINTYCIEWVNIQLPSENWDNRTSRYLHHVLARLHMLKQSNRRTFNGEGVRLTGSEP